MLVKGVCPLSSKRSGIHFLRRLLLPLCARGSNSVDHSAFMTESACTSVSLVIIPSLMLSLQPEISAVETHARTNAASKYGQMKQMIHKIRHNFQPLSWGCVVTASSKLSGLQSMDRFVFNGELDSNHLTD